MLLSATPSLGNSTVLLNLLRLIDPDNYNELTIEQIETRVEKSQEIGAFLRGLRGDAADFLINQRLNDLENQGSPRRAHYP